MSTDSKVFVQPSGQTLGSGSAAVMMKPDLSTAEALAVPGGQDPEDLHVTVQFLGPVEDLPPKEEIVKVLEGLVPSGKVTVKVSKPTTFPKGDDGVPVIRKVTEGAEPLEAMRKGLADAGVPDASSYDYNPHMTLAYGADEGHAENFKSQASGIASSQAEIPLTSTVLGWGDDVETIRPSAVARLSRMLRG